MADQARERIGMPLSEWERRWDEEGPFDLINGEIVNVPLQVLGQAMISKRFFMELIKLEDAGIGETFIRIAYVKMDGPDWVTASYLSSVVFYLKATMDHYKATTPNYMDLPFTLLPDIVLQVIHPAERYIDVEDKIAGYLADGVQRVWVANMVGESLRVCDPNHGGKLFTKNDTLTDPLLPGFSLELKDVFNM